MYVEPGNRTHLERLEDLGTLPTAPERREENPNNYSDRSLLVYVEKNFVVGR